MKAEDYEVVKVIGRGAFGEVQLVRRAHLFLPLWRSENKTSFECLEQPNLFGISLSFSGETQSHKQGICNEAVEQVWDDQEVGLCFLLGRERHHGFCKQLMGGTGMAWWEKTGTLPEIAPLFLSAASLFWILCFIFSPLCSSSLHSKMTATSTWWWNTCPAVTWWTWWATMTSQRSGRAFTRPR